MNIPLQARRRPEILFPYAVDQPETSNAICEFGNGEREADSGDTRTSSNCQYNQLATSPDGLDRPPRLFILLQSPHTKGLSELSEGRVQLSCFQARTNEPVRVIDHREQLPRVFIDTKL